MRPVILNLVATDPHGKTRAIHAKGWQELFRKLKLKEYVIISDYNTAVSCSSSVNKGGMKCSFHTDPCGVIRCWRIK